MRILIGADICPINRNEAILCNDRVAASTKEFFGGYDLFLANLESPLTETELSAVKYGESFRANPKTLIGLKSIGINLLSLANNHVMDQGEQGLNETIKALNDYKIDWFGAGNDLAAAAQPYFFEHDTNRIGLLAFSEPFFAAASRKRAGVNIFDVPHIVRSFIAMPEDCFKIVLLHGGNEHCSLPNPQLKDVARMLIELGANLIVVQHSHCIAGYEEWNDGIIFYGQGNFLFDYPFENKSWFTGFLIEIIVTNNQLDNYRIIPFEQSADNALITVLAGEQKQSILDKISECSAIIRNDERYEKEWDRYCEELRRSYQSIILGHGDLLFRLNRKFGISDRLISRETMMLQGRTFRCPSHLEVIKNLYSIEKTTK
ncbi:MAG: CapA family protein [Planctomycetaceae bacterium]|jgi:poly-gamma-glutamate synthesis protein (capsule biosynthesis protein)|nr:CapA family protein [Planctomycetaceae bacterium]